MILYKMTLQELNKIFVYTTDTKSKNVFEDWTLPKTSIDGKIYGDCEDYLLCLIFYCKIPVKIFYCVNELTQEGHVIGQYNNQYIDNNTKQFTDKPLNVYKIIRRIYPIEMYFRIGLSYIGFYKGLQLVKNLFKK